MRLSVITDEISQDLGYALDVCEELGVDIVELRAVGGTNIISHGEDSQREIKSTLDDRGFRVCAIASPFLKCHAQGHGEAQGATHGAAPASRDEQWEILNKAFKAAHLFEASLVRTFSFWRLPEPESVSDELVEVLTEATAQAEAEDLTLALENEHECNVGTGAETGRMLDRISSPYFGVIWDPGNEAMLGSEPFPDGYGHVRGRVAHVHLKDVSEEGNWTKMGSGTIAYPEQLRALADDGYSSVLSLETHYKTPEGGLEGATRESISAIRKICEQAGITLDA